MATGWKCPFLITLTFTLFVISSSSSNDESELLLRFKSSINDPRNSLSSWSNTSSLHHCNWTGISCVRTPSLYISSINLQSLNLSGDISDSLCDLPYLTHLDLSDNLFNQPIPLHLSRCSTLETLNLSKNLIWGTIPDQISQFESLKVLDFNSNHLEGKVPDGIGSLFNLQVLNLASNLLSGTLPSVFGNFTELLVLDLSENAYLVDEIPSGIGKLKKLEQLLLHSSGFHGFIPSSFVGLQSLAILDLSLNNLTGEIPPSLGSSMNNLVSFDVSQNKISGSFPSGICTGKKLINLSVHTNFLEGTIPTSSLNECLNLERFQVQNNGLSGDFPSGLWSLSKIRIIRAENNRFSGQMPDSISLADELEQVQIDNNSFTGTIPNGLGLIKSLYRFSASFNGFYGTLPPNFCDSPVLSIVNLSRNKISGKIPEVKNCKKLVSLSLADNSLTGGIPTSLADLPVLTYLDLSNNNLTGTIPERLQNLKLALFNVSFNQLSGTVPYSLISGLPASFMQGNPGLCGPGLPKSCSSNKINRHSAGVKAFLSAMITIAIAVAVLLVAGGFFMLYRYVKRKSQSNGTWRSVFYYPLRLTDEDLLMGINKKNAAGNGGPFGGVYIISLHSGEQVAVKKLVKFGNQSSKALKAEIRTIARIRHKNIVKVLGFCHSDESVFLIYEFLKDGSLHDLITKPDSQLPWNVRLKIAIGVAQGLAYLHKDYVPHLIHRNLKSKNILLDSDFEPKLADFALDRVLGESGFQSIVSTDCANSCYLAPEFSYSKKATEEMDVYSFGIVLLELITGRQAEQSESQPESLDILKWVRRKVNITDGSVQILDQKISSSSDSSREDMLAALEIALHCTSVAPEKRPLMQEVIRELQSLSSCNDLQDLRISDCVEEHHIDV